MRTRHQLLQLALLGLALSSVGTSSPVRCVDFCEGQPLIHDDGKNTRSIYLNTCSPTDSFALACDDAPTISCACKQDSQGSYFFTRGEDRGPPECETLCQALNQKARRHWWQFFSW